MIENKETYKGNEKAYALLSSLELAIQKKDSLEVAILLHKLDKEHNLQVTTGKIQ